jgi:hypothetical protein
MNGRVSYDDGRFRDTYTKRDRADTVEADPFGSALAKMGGMTFSLAFTVDPMHASDARRSARISTVRRHGHHDR